MPDTDLEKEIAGLVNGHPSDAEKAAVAEIKSIQVREAVPPRTMAEVGAPFAQRDHNLLLESVDRVAGDWVEQLRHSRGNSQALEEMVLQRVTKLKADLTQLFVLGGAVLSENKRSDEVNEKLADELNKLCEEHQVS
jgi:hypothetical protein